MAPKVSSRQKSLGYGEALYKEGGRPSCSKNHGKSRQIPRSFRVLPKRNTSPLASLS